MILKKENVLRLSQCGYCAETILRVYPDVSRTYVSENSEKKKRWQDRKNPSQLFSNSMEQNVILKRQLAAAAATRYLENHKFSKTLRVYGACSDGDPKLVLELSQETYPKLDPQNEGKAVTIDLLMLATSFQMVVHGLQEYESALPTINEVLSIVEGLFSGEFFLATCTCNRPVLLENRNTRQSNGDFIRNFFLCPWCGNRSASSNEFFERILENHQNWVGNENHA